MSDIVMKSNENECGNTGTRFNMIRTCPICKQELIYKDKYRFRDAITENAPCRKCRVPNRSSLEEFVKKARVVHGNKYDYSQVVYVNSRERINILCPIHGEFSQCPVRHISGDGCVKCSGR